MSRDVPDRLLAGREREEHRGAFVWFARSPDFSAVSRHNAVGECEPDAAALEFVASMQLLKDLKKLGSILHFKTDAIVANEIDVLSILFLVIDFNFRVLAPARKFKRI